MTDAITISKPRNRVGSTGHVLAKRSVTFTEICMQATIDRLKLNDRDCLTVREDYATDYFQGDISLGYLRRRAPFLAREIERQGMVL